MRVLRRYWSGFRSLLVVGPRRVAGPGFQVYRQGGPERLMEQRGECHSHASPVYEAKTAAHAAPIHVALKIQGGANWAPQGKVALRQAESELRDEDEEGGKDVI